MLYVFKNKYRKSKSKSNQFKFKFRQVLPVTEQVAINVPTLVFRKLQKKRFFLTSEVFSALCDKKM